MFTTHFPLSTLLISQNPMQLHVAGEQLWKSKPSGEKKKKIKTVKSFQINNFR